MTMMIRAIKFFNFGVYYGEQLIEPVARDQGGKTITLIGGLNGRGKTSLLDAVLLALYGQRSPSVRAYGKSYSDYLESLVHRGVQPDVGSYVELVLDLPGADGLMNIRLRRSWRLANVRFTDRLETWRNGLPDLHLAESWDTHVEELIPSGLAGLFFFDGERIGELADADETDVQLRQSIRSLLGLDLVDRLIADMGIIIRRHQSRLRDAVTRAEMARLQSKQEELQQQSERKKQDLAQIATMIARYEAALEEKESAFYEEGGRLAESREQLNSELTDLTASLKSIRSEAAQLAAGPLPLLLVSPLFQQVEQAIAREQAILEARAALKLLQERDDRLLSQLSSVMPANLLGELQSWLDRNRADYEQLAAQPVLFGLSPEARVALRHFLAQREHLYGGASALRSRYERTADLLEQVREHLSIHVDQDKVREALAQVADITQSLAHLKQQQIELQRELREIAQEQERVARHLTDYAAGLEETEEAERIVRYAARTQEFQREFRERATQQKIAALTRYIEEAFATLTHKSSLVSEIHMDPGTLRISLHDQAGRELPKARLSSGERQMLAIAILWGLARASNRQLPVIIDTPMGRLDSSHRMNFVSKYLPQASHQVIVLSTDTEIVGPYLDVLNGHVGRRYLLEYDDETHRTRVTEGYFAESGSLVL